MNFSSPKTLNEFILRFLQHGPIKATKLIEEIKKERSSITKQGAYAALRSLKKDEIVVIHGGLVSLNSVWVATMAKYFSLAQHYYMRGVTGMDGFLDLKDGEKVQYFFHDPTSTDAFWSHVFNLLVETSPSNEPIYLYNPHDWFLLARHENEFSLIEHVKARGKSYFMTVGNHDFLDTYIRKYFDGTETQYYATPQKMFKKENYYLNIFSDFLIEVWIDPLVADAINEFYRKTKQFTEKEDRTLKEIVFRKGHSKLVVSRNSKKAERFRKMFTKFFYLPKS